MGKQTILIVEDENSIQELICYNLEKEGYKTLLAESGEVAISKTIREKPDLILLDLMLPGVDGLDVCRNLKSNPDSSKIPVIMVTAKGEESDIVTGLEMGADDFIVKPFSPKVMLSRVKAVLRRHLVPQENEPRKIKFKNLVIHPGHHEVLVNNEFVKLTFTEFNILLLLARKPGWVFTRGQIVDAVRGDGYAVTDRAIDFQIVGLRKKLGTGASFIQTVRGVGYKFSD